MLLSVVYIKNPQGNGGKPSPNSKDWEAIAIDLMANGAILFGGGFVLYLGLSLFTEK